MVKPVASRGFDPTLPQLRRASESLCRATCTSATAPEREELVRRCRGNAVAESFFSYARSEVTASALQAGPRNRGQRRNRAPTSTTQSDALRWLSGAHSL